MLLGPLGQALAAPTGERMLALFNPHTGEHFRDVYWADGDYVAPSLRRIDWLMRDFHRDKVADIDPSLIDLLHRLVQCVDSQAPLHILSGYRTGATNQRLRREGFAPAPHSLHMHAQAADIWLEHVSLRNLRHAALSLQAGGVGTYPNEHFIHVDVGPIRSWWATGHEAS
jgi:uncharacterized protein YcbK (DUF882 family)